MPSADDLPAPAAAPAAPQALSLRSWWGAHLHAVVLVLRRHRRAGRWLRADVQVSRAGAVAALVAGLLIALAVRPVVQAAAGAEGTAAPGGNIVGRMGVTTNAAGHPVLVGEVCRGAVTEVYVITSADGQDEDLADVDLFAVPLTQPFTVDLVAPGPRWSGHPAPPPAAGDRYNAMADGDDDSRIALLDVDFTAADLTELAPGEVQYTDGYDEDGRLVVRRVPGARFHDVVCGVRSPGTTRRSSERPPKAAAPDPPGADEHGAGRSRRALPGPSRTRPGADHPPSRVTPTAGQTPVRVLRSGRALHLPCA